MKKKSPGLMMMSNFWNKERRCIQAVILKKLYLYLKKVLNGLVQIMMKSYFTKHFANMKLPDLEICVIL
jgi:hypothetical protein